MMSKLLADLSTIDLAKIVEDREAIARTVPQRFEMLQLDAIHWFDPVGKVAVASRVIRPDEWWVRGHIPGRPIFPGVLMVEAAAQLCVWTYRHIVQEARFLGFGGIDAVRFRGTVTPGQRVVLLARLDTLESRRATFETQSVVGDRIVYQGRILGMAV